MQLLNKIKSVLVEPLKFFDSLKKEKGVKQAFIYFMLLSLFSTVLGFIVFLFTQPLMYDLASKMLGVELPKSPYSNLQNILFTVLGYLLGLGISFISAALLHVWILIFGGIGKFEKTYQLCVYSKTPALLLGWIPGVGFVIWLYDLVLLIIGTQRLHRISRTKSILMYVIPLVIILAFYAVIMFVFFKYIMPFTKTLPRPV